MIICNLIKYYKMRSSSTYFTAIINLTRISYTVLLFLKKISVTCSSKLRTKISGLETNEKVELAMVASVRKRIALQMLWAASDPVVTILSRYTIHELYINSYVCRTCILLMRTNIKPFVGEHWRRTGKRGIVRKVAESVRSPNIADRKKHSDRIHIE